MREQIERQDRYRPFSMQTVKTALFFALAGIEIVAGPNPRVPIEEQYYTCRFASRRSRWRFNTHIGHKSETFSLYIWQINYWLNGSRLDKNGNPLPLPHEGRGQKSGPGALLDWLDNEGGAFLTKFPYPYIKRSHARRWLGFFRRRKFQGPFPDLAGFTWSQYRLATEAMQSYMQLSNSLVIMKQRGTFSDEQMLKQTKTVDLARAMFLATIFIAKVKFIETSTGMIREDYHYESNQITDNAEYFRNFPDTQWQVILFWWTGIMHSLSKTYPHVFKVQKVSNKQPSSAMEIYTATIATMQKYVGINEKDCNNQSYSLVLEQLERMSKENEELERLRKKK